MTSYPGDGEPPSDPYRRPTSEPTQPAYGDPTQPAPGEPTQPTYGDPAGGPQEGYWQQQAQQPGYGPPQGQPPYQQPYPPYPVTAPNHGGALASMIVGIVSLVLACGYGVGLLGAPVAWYLGSKSMREIDASQGRLGGRGMAQAGKVMGIIGTVLLVLLLIAVVVIVVIVAVNSGSGSDF